MKIPTEPIGSIPRPPELIAAIAAAGDFADPALDPLYENAVRETIEEFEATGSPVITDGEQNKYHNFCTYCIHGSPNTARSHTNSAERQRPYGSGAGQRQRHKFCKTAGINWVGAQRRRIPRHAGAPAAAGWHA